MTLDWPARSPELNLIENIWSWMKKVIRKRTKPGYTLIKLERLLENSWAEVPQTMIDTLIRRGAESESELWSRILRFLEASESKSEILISTPTPTPIT